MAETLERRVVDHVLVCRVLVCPAFTRPILIRPRSIMGLVSETSIHDLKFCIFHIFLENPFFYLLNLEICILAETRSHLVI